MRARARMGCGRVGVCVALAAVSGCGRDRYDLVDVGPDAERDADSDAGTQDAGCVLGPWGAPRLVRELSSPEVDYIGEIRGDGLVAYLSSNRRTASPADYDLYVATRASRADAFGTPVPVQAGDGVYEADASTSGDHLDIVFVRDACLTLGSRARTTESFGAFVEATELCGATFTGTGPYLSPDGL